MKKALLENKVEEIFDDLSPLQKNIAKAALQKKEQLAMISISEFAVMAKASEASITRFVRKLGFTSYSNFQNSMKQQVMQRINTIDKMQNSMEHNDIESELIRQSIEKDKNTMNTGIEKIDSKKIETIVEKVCNAKNVYLVGLASSKVLVEFLSYRFRWMGISVQKCIVGGTEFFENLVMLSEDDVVICVGFRKTYKEVQVALEYAKKKGAYTIGIAEDPYGLIIRKSDISLQINRGPEGEWNSLAFPMSVCNMLVVGILSKRKEEALKVANNLQWLNDKFKEI